MVSVRPAALEVDVALTPSESRKRHNCHRLAHATPRTGWGTTASNAFLLLCVLSFAAWVISLLMRVE